MTTEFELKQVIHTTPERFWERLHKSEEFALHLYVESLGFGYEPLEVDHEGGSQRVRIIPKVPAPPMIVKLLGMDFSFVEEGVLGDDLVYRFRIIPSSLADRISVRGEMRVLPDEEGDCIRHMRFTIDVSLPGIGPVVEKFFERSTRQSYADSQRITNRYLEEREAGMTARTRGASEHP